MPKRYTLHCVTFVSFPDEFVAFETDTKGAALAMFNQHFDRDDCTRNRLHDNHTGQDIEHE